MIFSEDAVSIRDSRQVLLDQQRKIHSGVPGLVSRISPYIDRPQLLLAQDCRVWILAPQECDPLTGRDGRCVLPPSAVADLRRIAAAGMEFHAIAIAHEVDPDGPVRRLVPQLQDGPRSCPPDLARILVGPVPPDPRAAWLARSMGQAMAALARPVTALAQRADEFVRRLDPVVFGLIGVDGRLEPGSPVLWVACTMWEW
jgi:hypothetical protein